MFKGRNRLNECDRYEYVNAMEPNLCVGDKIDTWGRMLKLLECGGTDIAFGPFSSRQIHGYKVNFTEFLYVDDTSILFGNTRVIRQKLRYLSIFNWEVWLSLLLSMLLVAVVSTVITKVLQQQKRITDNKFLFLENLWHVSVTFLNQGSTQKDLQCFSHSVLLTYWYLAVVVLLSTISGTVILSVLGENKEIDLELLLDKPEIQLTVPANTTIMWNFKLSTDYRMRDLWLKMENSPGSIFTHEVSVDTILDKVEQGTHAFMSWTKEVEALLGRRVSQGKSCKFQMSKRKYYPWHYSMAVRQNLSRIFVENLNKKIVWLRKSYLVSMWLNWEIRNSTFCLTNESPGDKTLNFSDVRNFFYIWCSGIVCAVGTFVVEYLISKMYLVNKNR
ncbi:uncharacterized protein LOC143244142 [Tachypleus tridentatus]|uniref:uncharacterized protein LOC143244142 n=1 Tax=Tachypleus tridentatus TaxID=6853 RepID=UPI003FD134E0